MLKEDLVSHPSHYQSESGLEVIDVIKAFTEGLEGIEATDTGNIIKYACRWKKKNGVQDLEKLVWYAQHLINHIKEEEKAQKLVGLPSVTGFHDLYGWTIDDLCKVAEYCDNDVSATEAAFAEIIKEQDGNGIRYRIDLSKEKLIKELIKELTKGNGGKKNEK